MIKSWDVSNDILDLPDEKPKRKKFVVLGYVGFGLILVGMAFRFFHWPFANLILLVGGVGLVIRNVLAVVLNRSVNMKVVLYYLGYSMVVIGMVGVWLHWGVFFRWLIAAAVGVFFVQFLWSNGKSTH